MYQQLKDEFEAYLGEECRTLFAEKNPLTESILYSLLSPGKRIRPILCLSFAESFATEKERALACSLAVEMIHTYSLIHDDLPAMDNDDFRRGRKTNHKVFGEAMAILAGDSLLTEAPAFLLRQLHASKLAPEQTITLVTSLLEASGHRGMAQGQAMDISFEQDTHASRSKEGMDADLKKIHSLKTGALFSWSCQAGLLASGSNELINRHLPSVQRTGEQIGLLFQIVDDVLDVTGSIAEIGKTPGKDGISGKLTYTNLHGLEGARQLGILLADQILQELDALNIKQSSPVREIIHELKTKLG